MIEAFAYWFMNLMGYRLYCFDYALERGIRLTHYTSWIWRPWKAKGTYRERRYGYECVGYGVDL